MPRSRPRLASSSNAIIFAAISSSPPWRTCGPADARDGRHAGQQSLPAAGPRLIARSRRLAVVTLAGRVPTPCLALSGGECKRKGGMTSPARRRTARTMPECWLPARVNALVLAGGSGTWLRRPRRVQEARRLQPFGLVLFGRVVLFGRRSRFVRAVGGGAGAGSPGARRRCGQQVPGGGQGAGKQG